MFSTVGPSLLSAKAGIIITRSITGSTKIINIQGGARVYYLPCILFIRRRAVRVRAARVGRVWRRKITEDNGKITEDNGR